MSKVKYIGNFTDGTGWSRAGMYNALALDHYGYDITAVDLKYSKRTVSLSEPRMYELLAKKEDGVSMVFQHVLPSEYIKYPGVKNIGCLVLETKTLNNPLWIKKIKLMDEIWVPSKYCYDVVSKIHDNVKIIPYFFNVDMLAARSELILPEIQNRFNFLFVGENVRRKNIELLIRAFCSEFRAFEPVNLLIKTNQDINIKEIVDKCRLNHRAREPFIITEYLSDVDLYTIMSQCHSFVMPSAGEGWCYPLAEAAHIGLWPIYTNNIGAGEFMGEVARSSKYAIPSYDTYCFGESGVDGLYTSDDIWSEPCIISLRAVMRYAHQNYKEKESFKLDHLDYRLAYKELDKI